MGNGASCTKIYRSESVQMPSLPSSASIMTSGKPTFRSVPSTPVEPIDSKEFKAKPNLDRYTSIWDQNIKLTNPFQRILKAEFDKEQHHQKETIQTEWKKKNSVTRNSAHVESTLSTQSHSCINLSTSEKIDEVIRKLNQIHTQLDETIRKRTEQISVETESVLAQIINETQEEQQRLLQYAKKRQNQHDETYREKLEKFLAQLDAERAEEIAQLQSELEKSREEILRVSQLKIMSVNEQANIAKSKIVHLEQQNSSMKIENLNVQLENFTTDQTFQQFGTESMSRTSIAATSHIGEKATGHNCSFEFLQDVPNESQSNEKPIKTAVTTTIYTNLRAK